MPIYVVKAKDYSFIANAENTKEAFAKFFADFIDSNRSIDELGDILKIDIDDDEIAFRTVPTLVLLGKLSVSDGIFNIRRLLDIDTLEACEVLQQCMEQDEWILNLIEEVDLSMVG